MLNSPTPGPSHVGMLGLGAYRPRRVVGNDEVVAAIDSSDEWIQQRSGIAQRRWAGTDETVTMMSVSASRDALAHAGVAPADVDTVLVATVTHLRQTPAVATAIADELGCPNPAAFDISAACAGFCYGLGLAADLVRGGTAGYVLVIGVERLSDILDTSDRGTAFLFADGAGAAVVGPTQTPGIGPVAWGSDGSQREVIQQRADWREVTGPAEAPGSGLRPALEMEGRAVFRWAAYAMVDVAQDALKRAGVTVDELDLFVPHQANMRITDVMTRALSIPDHVRVARDIAVQGNSSAASIPLALQQMIEDGQAHHGDLALLIGFGAGLAYAAQVIAVP